MKLSIVTGALNRPEAFLRLVSSIVDSTTVDWEMVVADASDTTMSSRDPRIRILAEKPRLGCVKGYNRAFREARGEWVIWLNDDCEVVQGYDVESIALMEANPTIGLGALHYSENGGPFHVNSAWHALYANFGIIRRELGDQLGWFDEDLTMYGNDNSLTCRVLMAGFGVADIPKARILHHAIDDAERLRNKQYQYRDNAVIQHKYLPHQPKWIATYLKHRLPNDTEPWPHGIQPA